MIPESTLQSALRAWMVSYSNDPPRSTVVRPLSLLVEKVQAITERELIGISQQRQTSEFSMDFTADVGPGIHVRHLALSAWSLCTKLLLGEHQR